jgi:uncharacterized protein
MPEHPFWIGFGDIHEQTGQIRLIPDLDRAEAVIVSGDLTNRGRASAARRILADIQKFNPRIYAQVGNMDFPEVEQLLEAQGMNIHARGMELDDGIGLMGVGYSNPTPFGTPGEVPDEQLAEWLAQAYKAVQHLPHLLLVAHNPPFDTPADKVGGSVSVGSHAVRKFIEDVQPEVCLTGHIHEARAEANIGRTRVINPGPVAGGGYALIWKHQDGLRAELRMISASPQGNAS